MLKINNWNIIINNLRIYSILDKYNKKCFCFLFFVKYFKILKYKKKLGLFINDNNIYFINYIYIFISKIKIIIIYINNYNNGKFFSISYYIKKNLNFRNILCAIGNFFIDQIFYMKRTGFDIFFSYKYNILNNNIYPFTINYQASYDKKKPIFYI